MAMVSRIFSIIPSWLVVFSASIFLSGCAVSDLSATGGSRADGTVVMSAEYGAFDYIDVNKNEALAAATRRCQSWGYNSAQSFDAGISKCSSFSGFGCDRYIYSLTYQCIQ
ncbi:hypothetical protein CKQ16_10295 [Salmonella enterica subsp. enterica serovar Newport]|nr:hypothetical protein [Salmonella enterica subsp. enterica serovar Newport]